MANLTNLFPILDLLSFKGFSSKGFSSIDSSAKAFSSLRYSSIAILSNIKIII